jgi:mycofactocin system glycosyltransferase
MPSGVALALDTDTVEIGEGLLVGGRPRRALRLTPAGRAALAEIRRGATTSGAARVLGRRLTDAGLAHPRPSPQAEVSVTIVVPVRDRREALARCLAAMGADHAIVVVDDGSRDPVAIAAIAERHGARVIRRDSSNGPAAARNAGVGATESELLAFIDSDCLAPRGWVDSLAGHFQDPLVAAVAPRVVPAVADTSARRYAVAAGALDLGTREARVTPLSSVSYVPTAALIVRRSALADLGFDESMRYGEDVDVIWRLHNAGWRIRFDPSVEVRHDEPATWRALLSRRFRYGTSAAPLAARHGEAMAPLVVQPLAAATVATMLSRRPVAAAATLLAGVASTCRSHRAAGLPASDAGATYLRAVAATWIGVGRCSTQLAPAALAAGIVIPGRDGRRLAFTALAFAGPLSEWARRRPRLWLPAFVAARIADDIAYGTGVWAGALRHRTVAPLRPVLHRRRGARG